MGTVECKKAYEPLISNVTDGFKIADENLNLVDIEYECENHKSVYDSINKTKLDGMIGKELAEGYFKIVNSKPTLELYLNLMGD